MIDLNTLALLLCAAGVLLATCLVIRAAFGAPRRRQGALRTTLVSASPNYVVLSGAEKPPLVAKPYSDLVDERESMTQEQWDEMQKDLQAHLKGVEDRFWEANSIPPKPYSEFDPLHWSKKPL